MAGRGRAPRAEDTKHGERVLRTFSTIHADEVVRGPDLPAGDWPDATVALYEALRRSPMAQQWLTVDWLNLQDVMRLHAAYTQGELRHAPELRLRLGQYGVTPEARMRLRLMVDEAPAVGSKWDEFQRKHGRK